MKLLAAILLTTSLFAKNIVSGSTSATLRTTDSNNSIQINGGYSYVLPSNIGIDGSIKLISAGQTITELYAGGHYNIGQQLEDAIHFGAGLSLFSVASVDHIGFYINGGKRFPLFANVQYSPSIQLNFVNSSTAFDFNFVSASFTF